MGWVYLVLFIYIHKRKILAFFAVVFVLYLVNMNTEKVDAPPLIRDSVSLCKELDDYNEKWRGKSVGIRTSKAIEIQEKSLAESSLFQTPVAQLLQAEIEADAGASIGVRRDLSRLCDQVDNGLLPP